jgi:hypothetical protein
MSADNVKTALDTAAQRPANAQIDGQAASSHKLTDIIAAHRHLSAEEAAADTTSPYKPLGVAVSRIQPGGAA